MKQPISQTAENNAEVTISFKQEYLAAKHHKIDNIIPLKQE
jgi:hypothetical protein